MSGEPPLYRGREVHSFTGHIDLENVECGDQGEPVVRDICLDVGAGQTIAIIGPNGAGKSTLLHLILGFDRPLRGERRAHGVQSDRIVLVEPRRRIGMVMQHPVFNHLENAVVHGLLANLSTLDERPGVLVISRDRDVLGYADRVYRIEGGSLAEHDLPPVPRVAAASVGAP